MGPKLSIKSVKEQTGVSGHTLRYYENVGLLSNIGRLENGRRFYTDFNVEWIKTLRLLRSTGMSIQKIRHLAHLINKGDATIEERIAYFKEYQAELRQQIAMRQQALRTM